MKTSSQLHHLLYPKKGAIFTSWLLFVVGLQLLGYLFAMILLYPHWGVWSIAVLQIAFFLIPSFAQANFLNLTTQDWLYFSWVSLKSFLQISLLTLILIFLSSAFINYFIKIPEVKYEEYARLLLGVSLWQQGLILVLIPAFCEEVLFRGFLFSILEKSWGGLLALLTVTFLFVLGHLNEVTLYFLPHYIMLGILLGLIRWWKKNLLLCVWVHVLNNLIALIFWNHSFKELFANSSAW